MSSTPTARWATPHIPSRNSLISFISRSRATRPPAPPEVQLEHPVVGRLAEPQLALRLARSKNTSLFPPHSKSTSQTCRVEQHVGRHEVVVARHRVHRRLGERGLDPPAELVQPLVGGRRRGAVGAGVAGVPLDDAVDGERRPARSAAWKLRSARTTESSRPAMCSASSGLAGHELGDQRVRLGSSPITAGPTPRSAARRVASASLAAARPSRTVSAGCGRRTRARRR